jgi:hypothetical protein
VKVQGTDPQDAPGVVEEADPLDGAPQKPPF